MECMYGMQDTMMCYDDEWWTHTRWKIRIGHNEWKDPNSVQDPKWGLMNKESQTRWKIQIGYDE